MRKKERIGPGIETLDGSADPILASSEPGALVARVARARHQPKERVAARLAERRRKDLACRFLGKSVQRRMRAFKISSPKRKWSLNGTIEMRKKRIWTLK